MKRIVGVFWLLLLMAVPAFATVSVETTRVAYTCNGVLTSYAYPFKVLSDADLLVVKKATATSAETTLTLNTDYTVTGAGTSGGNVVLTAGSKCGSGYTLTILRDMAATQTTDYVDGEAFSAVSIEDALDKVTMIQQQQREQIGRAPKLPETSTITDISLPNPTANNYIGWNAGATGLENKSSPVITTATQYEVDALVSYGSGTSYTQATIEAALAAIGTTNKVTLLLRPGTWVISSDLTIPSNVSLKVVPGAILQIATGITLTINGPFEAGLYQVFDCVGTGKVVFGSGSVTEAFPEWWGAVGNDIADDRAAIQSALDSGAGEVHLSRKIYRVTNTLLRPCNVMLRGSGSYPEPPASIISVAHNGIGLSTAPSIMSGESYSGIENLTVENALGFTPSIGIFLENLVSISVEKVRVKGFTVGMKCHFVQFSQFHQIVLSHGITGWWWYSVNQDDGNNKNEISDISINYCTTGLKLETPGTIMQTWDRVNIELNDLPLEIIGGSNIVFNNLYVEANTQNIKLTGGSQIIFNYPNNVSAQQFIQTLDFGATKVDVNYLNDLSESGVINNKEVSINSFGKRVSKSLGILPANTVGTITVSPSPSTAVMELSVGVLGLINSGRGILKMAVYGDTTDATLFTVHELLRVAVPDISISAVTKYDGYFEFTITSSLTLGARVDCIFDSAYKMTVNLTY